MKKIPFKYTNPYFNLKSKLEDILKRQVDLLEDRANKNKFFKHDLDTTKVIILILNSGLSFRYSSLY